MNHCEIYIKDFQWMWANIHDPGYGQSGTNGIHNIPFMDKVTPAPTTPKGVGDPAETAFRRMKIVS